MRRRLSPDGGGEGAEVARPGVRLCDSAVCCGCHTVRCCCCSCGVAVVFASAVATSEDKRQSRASVRKRPGHFLCLAKESNQRKALPCFESRATIVRSLRGHAGQGPSWPGPARAHPCARPSGLRLTVASSQRRGEQKSQARVDATPVGAAQAATAPMELRRTPRTRGVACRLAHHMHRSRRASLTPSTTANACPKTPTTLPDLPPKPATPRSRPRCRCRACRRRARPRPAGPGSWPWPPRAVRP